jgi:SAM-dependent methyltransferase
MSDQEPKLYSSLAEWFHLLTRPEDYAEEAEFYRRAILSASTETCRTLLELGCGGGNNASWMKEYFQLTLTDIAPDMLAVSRSINPECEHLLGDMRTLRLDRVFDAVFIHDAVSFLTTLVELRQAIETAWIHCRPGGVALFTPDFVRENFRPGTSHGGHDGTARGMRYLEWIWDPNPSDDTYLIDFAYLLRDEAGELRVESDRHRMGLFSRSAWLDTLRQVGFEPRPIPFEHSEVEPGTIEVFLGIRLPG